MRTQGAEFGDSLDDVIVDAVAEGGRPTHLHLQIKNKLAFTENDSEWTDVLGRAWTTFSRPDFDPTRCRIGVGIGTYHAKADQHYQSVLRWAEHSTDAAHFLERIAKGDYSHPDKKSFVGSIQEILAGRAGRPLADDELWRFLRAFVILHFDFQSGPGSRDASNAIERLRSVVPSQSSERAAALWDHLVGKAGELIPAGGGATRATLIEALARDAIGSAPSWHKSIQSLMRESQRALHDIRSDVHGLKIHRSDACEKVRAALAEGRFVQIGGEPGAGKSAVLREIAEDCARNGPVFVLKDNRIHPRGWSAHAHVLGLPDDVSRLLQELGCEGEPILFVDGIDKITDPGTQLTVNDVMKAIANRESLSNWRVLVTIRDQNLKHLETWLDPDALKKLAMRTIRVPPLKNEELGLVARAFPRLRPLLAQGSGADAILKRPFFLNALLSLSGDELPASEVELLNLWWEMGGAESRISSLAQHRRNLLMQAAEALVRNPGAPIAIRELAPESLEELKSAGVLRDKEFGHSAVFTHDIYEEWALCEYLIGRKANLTALLENAVRSLNRKPHRKAEIRQLVPYFVFSGDAALVERFTDAVRSFPERLPLVFEEENDSQDSLAALRERMTLFAEQADPQYFKTAPTPDGAHIQIWNEPPSLQKKHYKAKQEHHAEMNAFLGIAMWADNARKNGSADPQFAIEDAFEKARAWDEPDIFDAVGEDLNERYRAAAVVGTAFVVARHCPAETWTHEIAAWCLSVFQRAASTVNVTTDLSVRNASLLMHPAVFAAHGYAALLARGIEVARCQSALLDLVVDALEGVQVAVIESANEYATTYPEFYWVLVDLALHQCVVARDEMPDYHETAWEGREAEIKLVLLERAEAHLVDGHAPTLPQIPMPWIKGGKGTAGRRKGTRGYFRNETMFLYHLAEKLLAHISLEPILSDPARRAQFLVLVSALLDATFQEIVPPFADSKRDYRGSAPYEWIYAFSAWCGRLCSSLDPTEAEVIVSRICAQDNEAALLMMQSFMRGFMIWAFLKTDAIRDRDVALWSSIAEWLFSNPEWTRGGRRDHLDREFISCASVLLFCVVSDFSPLICGADPGWEPLKKFLPVIERAVSEFGTHSTLYFAVASFLKRGGMDLMPEPALTWLRDLVERKKSDQKFWQANGDSTVDILKELVLKKTADLSSEHRKLVAVIADILIDNGVRGAGFLQQEVLRAA
jgi:hypothetical protein